MMGALFCLGLLLYAPLVFRGKAAGGAVLAKLLWLIYFGLGLSATLIDVTGVLQPAFPPNYPAALFLTLCILLGVSGFLDFRVREVAGVIGSIRGQWLIEALLIGPQLYAIIFFMPHAITSLTGDANENRLNLSSTMELLGSYGIFNTFAGAASHLFVASLVMAGVRLSQAQGRGRSLVRAGLLVIASLSYVVYILAYVGRDGVVYWLMTALAVFLVFRSHMEIKVRCRVASVGAAIGGLILLPFIGITVARFADAGHGVAWSILDYFGSQINNFGDYSVIERPVTYGVMNFSMFVGAACSVAGLDGCESWEFIKPYVFDQYLAQGKEPWLFGTYVSDLVGDFGYLGAFISLAIFALICRRACGGGRHDRLSISRLLLVLFLFLVPYWGVFYFRFGIINGFIVVNICFVVLVWLIQLAGARRKKLQPGVAADPVVPERCRR